MRAWCERLQPVVGPPDCHLEASIGTLRLLAHAVGRSIDDVLTPVARTVSSPPRCVANHHRRRVTASVPTPQLATNAASKAMLRALDPVRGNVPIGGAATVVVGSASGGMVDVVVDSTTGGELVVVTSAVGGDRGVVVSGRSWMESVVVAAVRWRGRSG